MRAVNEGDISPTVRIRERLEARVAALAESMVRRNSEALAEECERLRVEAAEHLAAQCRELIALSRTVAAAEERREQRLRVLEDELRESLLVELERAVPAPLAIPNSANSGSLGDLWAERE